MRTLCNVGMLFAACAAMTACAAPSATERLRQNLLEIGKGPNFIWGHTIHEGEWNDAERLGRLRRETGISPIVYSADFQTLFGTFLSPERYATNRVALAAVIRREYDERHAVPVISWHFANPYTPPGWKAYSRSSQPFRYRYGVKGNRQKEPYPEEHRWVLREIVEGTGGECGVGREDGSVNERTFPNPRAWYEWNLREAAAFCRTLKDRNGRRIPLMFRFFHECECDWFWWGSGSSTPEDYIAAWRLTVDILRRELGRENVLFCYCADKRWGTIGEEGKSGFLARYPGDDYIDVIGYDDYDLGEDWNVKDSRKHVSAARSTAAVTKRMRLISEEGERRGKICGIFECGILSAGAHHAGVDAFYSEMLKVATAPGVKFAFIQTFVENWTYPHNEEGWADMRAVLKDPRILTDKSGVDLVCEARGRERVERANIANLAGRDHLGRELVSADETHGARKNRQVALFYYLWHGQHGTHGPWDVSKIEAADPKAMEKPDSPLWPDASCAPLLHWGEPLFGYYLSTDEWVLRRHVQMFIDAGIDALMFDTTNGYHYREVTDKLFKILEEYRAKGFPAPKFFYYMAPQPRGCGTSTVYDVWENYYAKGRYRDLWYELDGKPVMVARSDRPYRQEIRDCFTFRRPTWGTPSMPDTWYWGGMPTQNVAVSSLGLREMLPVTVGSPHIAMDAPADCGWRRGACAGCSEGYWGAPIQGRSWHDGHRDTRENAAHYGFFFQSQIDWALAKEREDVPLALVCQWNEWIAPLITDKTNEYYGFKRHWINIQDEYNMEFSRDIEPMKDGYKDAYYFQMMNFVRRWKGLPQPAKATRRHAICSADDWDAVSPEYVEMTGDCKPRDWPGHDACGQYRVYTGRNEFKSLKVAVGEDDCVYFRAETVEPLKHSTNANWMNLFVRMPGRPVDSMGYTHRFPEKGGGAVCTYDTKSVVYKVPCKALGVDSRRAFKLEFKWSDNRQSDDVMDFYVNGDAAPRGRLNWLFEFAPKKGR